MDPDLFKEHAPVLIYQFKSHKTKEVDVASHFQTTDTETVERLKVLTEMRTKLVAVLKKKDKIAKEVLQACESYFPHLYALVVSIENAKGKLRMKAPLSFSWSSCLAKDTRSSTYHPIQDIQYEAIMICLTYAFAHINRASELIISCTDDDFPEQAPAASLLLKTAAGIFEYVVERELPRWKTPPEAVDTRPLETSGTILKAFSGYCCSMAQALAVKKALLGQKTSKVVMAKLQHDVWQSQAQFEKTLRAHPAWKMDKIQVIFKSFIGLQVGLAKANTYRYTGEDYHEKDKIGWAVAFLTLAGDALKQVWVPNPASKLGRFTEEIARAKDDIEHVRRDYDNENNHIHLQKVPIEAELDLPEAKSLMVAEAWVPPRPLFESLK